MKVKSASKQILDRIDRRILRELQSNGRISNVELAKVVGLSATPCLERVRRLENDGFIEGYLAKLNPKKLSASLLVFIEIRLLHTSPNVFTEFNQAVATIQEILECHLVSGEFDYLLKARVGDMQEYRKLLGDTLLTLPGVSASRSYMVMEEVKETSILPVSDKQGTD
ncbi:leucine-responsive transcriptional regulator Lrp [Kangiella sediminilitoris]|uniref:leucine-responsive transcriptional regulator Lrp n=1 Tax=Kangiella sediminilitoris TaxID=1144748 RepID=UPI00083E5BC7|nr:leucine-responsive transcriptional regulator Lrp [Kangiella sediminilitoris]